MAAINASSLTVLSTPTVALASTDRLASRRSVAFNNSASLRSMPCVRGRSAQVLPIRAHRDPKLDGESSAGGITDKAKKLAEEAASNLDGVFKTDPESTLKDGDRVLRSKEGDVEYAAQRNADEVGNKAQEVWNEVQSKFTKEK